MIDKLNTILLRIEDFLLSYVTVAMAILLIVNVFFRSVLNNSLSFAEELGGFFLVTVTFWGISTATRFNNHINMNAIIDNMPFKIRKTMTTIISFFTCIITAYLGYLFLLYALDSLKVSRISTALEIPMVIINMILAIGIFITALQYLLMFVKNITVKDVIYVGSQSKTENGVDIIFEADLKEYKSEEMEKTTERSSDV
ncbi:TRAP transporter small permease [Clostridium sp. MD294]|uniref:TRAP transporter small permease n=1 Tax=Clostridium sp. MD294 TaxID=97138 RepID=UPI0002CB497B|nr:TRAP transporter small permease [Clostridium sp. MD294]USF30402.1 Ectoine/5-hydroxyectoine TRAP transporter small permease protein UehB [Clostridium sp. MD294]